MKHKTPINTLFFGFFLILLLSLTVHHIFLIQQLSTSSRLFFLFYSISQLCCEFVILIFLSSMIKKRLNRSLHSLFIGFTFVWMLSHLIDFISVRMINLSMWHALKHFVINENMENFIELINLSGIPIWVWILLIPIVLLIPVVGVILYRISERASHHIPVNLSSKRLLGACLLIPIAMLAWDFSHMSLINGVDYHNFTKALPWKRTLMPHKKEILKLAGTLEGPPDEGKQRYLLSNYSPSIAKRPNVYMIVAESLRDDFVTIKSAPHLSRFKHENLSLDLSLANANATHLSWFAIFHARHPYKWVSMQEANWSLGAPPLQMFKKMGYKLRLYSAAQLKYYGMDELILGPDYALVDSLNVFPHYAPKEAWESDCETLDQLALDLDKPENQSGQLILIFWDSTHFNYSWPDDFETPFTPYAPDVNLLYSCGSKRDLKKIKNRYRNAIHFVDSLFGRFRTILEEKGLYNEALIGFTGDHGEEFFEHGQLFHASQLSQEQLSAPIFLKTNRVHRHSLPMGSHINIFPTFIHALTGDEVFEGLVDGRSLLGEESIDHVLSSHNAWRAHPTDFRIHNGEKSLSGRFKGKHKIEILKMCDERGCTIPFESKSKLSNATQDVFLPSITSHYK